MLLDSTLADKLLQLGYDLRPARAKRIIAGSITERLTLTSCGIFEVLTPESTKAVTEVRRHAGIARVQRFSFGLG
jgi:hypothetical protein